MSEPVRFPCPNCGVTIKVAFKHVGKIGRCPKCGASVQIPFEQELIAELGDSSFDPPPPATRSAKQAAHEILVDPLSVGIARTKSYSWQAVFTFLLYGFAFFPGLIANRMFLEDGERMEKIAGHPLPGVEFLRSMNSCSSMLLLIGLGIVGVIVGLFILMSVLGAIAAAIGHATA